MIKEIELETVPTLNELFNAFAILALHDLYTHTDNDGVPVLCDYETYCKQKENEFNHYWLTERQFNIIVKFIKDMCERKS